LRLHRRPLFLKRHQFLEPGGAAEGGKVDVGGGEGVHGGVEGEGALEVTAAPLGVALPRPKAAAVVLDDGYIRAEEDGLLVSGAGGGEVGLGARPQDVVAAGFVGRGGRAAITPTVGLPPI
jgi:hypothetical protein